MPNYSYECPNGHEYENVLPVSEYKKKTKCHKCKKFGKKTITLRQSEPTFTDKIFPYYDRSLNKIFQTKSDRFDYLKKKGLEESGKGSTRWSEERKLYDWRLGKFDPRIARHALMD